LVSKLTLTDQGVSELGLLRDQVLSKLQLLRCVLLLKLLAQSTLFVLVSLVDLELRSPQHVLLRQAHLLQRIVVLVFSELVFDFVQLFVVDGEVALDGVSFSQLLVRVLLQQKFQALLLLREVLHEKPGESLEELVRQVLVQKLELLAFLLLSFGRCAGLVLEQGNDVLLVNLLLLFVFLVKHVQSTLEHLLIGILLLLVLSTRLQEGLLLLETLCLQGAFVFQSGPEGSVLVAELSKQTVLLQVAVNLVSDRLDLVLTGLFALFSFLLKVTLHSIG